MSVPLLPLRLTCSILCIYFFFKDTAPSEIYTLSLHDALPISLEVAHRQDAAVVSPAHVVEARRIAWPRSEEHTSELQSHVNLVCRLLLEKKKKTKGKIALLRIRWVLFEIPP